MIRRGEKVRTLGGVEGVAVADEANGVVKCKMRTGVTGEYDAGMLVALASMPWPPEGLETKEDGEPVMLTEPLPQRPR